MAPDAPEGSSLKPVTPARVAQEITKLSMARKNGELNPDAYDQRFAKIIHELRDRRIQGGRAEINAALKPLVDQGTITQGEFDRLTKHLGLV